LHRQAETIVVSADRMAAARPAKRPAGAREATAESKSFQRPWSRSTIAAGGEGQPAFAASNRQRSGRYAQEICACAARGYSPLEGSLMSDQSALVLWSALALAVDLAVYALAYCDRAWLARLRGWLGRVRAALTSARRAVLPLLRSRLRPQLPSPPPVQPERPLAVLPPVKRRPRAPGECEHPIVLAHGWMAVDAFSLPGVRQEYFRGVREHLRAHGHRVYVSRVSPLAGVRRRAEQLAEQLAKIDADKVNIIAHSMGGLDARYAISRFGLAGRVASLTTIGTPHRGTPLADASLVLRDLPLLQRALRSQLGLDLDALHDLTTAQMAEFNEAVPDMHGVRYSSYIGCVRGGVRDVHTLLAPGFAFLKRRTGDNDGIVPATSQRWGDVVGEVRADHWAQIGWSQGLDVKTFYAAIARVLARAGL
jgi:triacylglycerol lipase